MSIVTEKSKLVFAENLTYFLQKKGKQQIDLVINLGVSKGAVSQWCSGKSSPSASMAQRIADYLNITLADLTTERKQLTKSELKFALFGGEVSDETLEDVLKYAEYVKQKNEKE